MLASYKIKIISILDLASFKMSPWTSVGGLNTTYRSQRRAILFKGEPTQEAVVFAAKLLKLVLVRVPKLQQAFP